MRGGAATERRSGPAVRIRISAHAHHRPGPRPVPDESGEQARGVAIAGRIVAWRPKGKVVFGHLEDADGRIQIYLRGDDLGDAFAVVKLLDLDDYVGVRGQLMKTKSG